MPIQVESKKTNKQTQAYAFSSQLIKILENYQEKLHTEIGLDEAFNLTEMPHTNINIPSQK